MLFVGIPHTRSFEGLFLDSMLGCDWPDFYFCRAEGMPVDVARNYLVKKFLSSACDHMLMIDSDARWGPRAVKALAAQDQAVISPCIYRRALPPSPTFGNFHSMNGEAHVYDFGPSIQAVLEKANKRKLDLTVENTAILDRDEGDMFEVDGVGAHFLMVRRDVLERVGPDPFQVTEGAAGEDFYFCRRVKEAGFHIFVDLAVQTGHIIGPGFDYGLREFLAFKKFTKEFDEKHDYWEL